MKLLDKIKKKNKYSNKRLLNEIENQNNIYEKLVWLNKNSPFAKQIFESDLKNYGKIAKDSEDLLIYVKKDEELTKKAVDEGYDSYLWDTNIMYAKLKRHFKETSNAPDEYMIYASYLSYMPKFVESDQITDIFKRFYYKNEIDYNEKIFDKTIFEISVDSLSPPLMAVFKYYLKNTQDVPYPSYIKALGRCPYNISAHITDLKPSEDGLSLVPCSHYEFNEITGNHWDNLNNEEQQVIIEKRNKDTEKWMKENGWYD